MENVPFAVAELPANIQDFDMVNISYLDATVLNFLRRMQPLFHNVEMRFERCNNVDNTRIALGHLLPFLVDGGIETLVVRSITVQPSAPTPLLIFMRDRFSAQFFAIKRLQLNVVLLDGVLELLLKWLHTPLADGQHRVLKFNAYCAPIVKYVEPIRQQFINATISANFFVSFSFWSPSYFEAIQESTTQNAGTNEQLLIRRKLLNGLIGRCQTGLDGQKWIKEMERKYQDGVAERGSQGARRIISLQDPTLGSFEEENKEGQQDEAEEKFDQPGPSEKPKMS